jgi:hypothetical protein
MVQMVFLSLSDSSEGWNIAALPGQITYRADTLATLARCRSRWAYDLQNCSSNHLQVQVSGLGRESRGVSQAAFSSAPPVGTVRTAHPANPGNDNRENGLFWKHSLLLHCQEPHTELVVEARSEVMMENTVTALPHEALPWEEAVRLLPEDHSPEGLEAYQFRFESPRIPLRPEFAAYALQSFTPGGRCGRAFWI